MLGEEDFDQLLELEDRAVTRGRQPCGQSASPLGGDGVDGPGPIPDFVGRGAGETVGDELLGLFVQLALGPRPELAQSAVHLLGELVGA